RPAPFALKPILPRGPRASRQTVLPIPVKTFLSPSTPLLSSLLDHSDSAVDRKDAYLLSVLIQNPDPAKFDRVISGFERPQSEGRQRIAHQAQHRFVGPRPFPLDPDRNGPVRALGNLGHLP